ncbi:hypothetical protein R1flu_006342 [Riccia fluitans]|uniref:Uncharacterized protein n=1 Tax=Riccia fluitans TaxID=41844 RepID=A0ABD1YVQ8_9MARC
MAQPEDQTATVMETHGPASSLVVEDQLIWLQNLLAESQWEQEHPELEVIRPLQDRVQELAMQLKCTQKELEYAQASSREPDPYRGVAEKVDPGVPAAIHLGESTLRISTFGRMARKFGEVIRIIERGSRQTSRLLPPIAGHRLVAWSEQDTTTPGSGSTKEVAPSRRWSMPAQWVM